VFEDRRLLNAYDLGRYELGRYVLGREEDGEGPGESREKK
jgi:hypothetical protein